MDPFADVLARARTRGALYAHSRLCAPWGIAFVDHTPLSFHAVLEGELYVEADGHEPLRLLQGDLLLVRIKGPYRFVHRPGAPAIALHDFISRAAVSGHDRRFALDGPGAVTEFLCGSYTFDNATCESLLRALPEFVPVRGATSADPQLQAAVGLLADELGRFSPGQQTVLDRLLELLLVYGLRAWLARPDATAPPWYRALDDPFVGYALRLIHTGPAHPWTLAMLASEVGLSRAAFARRFRRLTGESPLAYLTRWRMTLAEEALQRPNSTLAAVAEEIGYRSEFAFAAAFKRHHGIAPGKWRADQQAAPLPLAAEPTRDRSHGGARSNTSGWF